MLNVHFGVYWFWLGQILFVLFIVFQKLKESRSSRQLTSSWNDISLFCVIANNDFFTNAKRYIKEAIITLLCFKNKSIMFYCVSIILKVILKYYHDLFARKISFRIPCISSWLLVLNSLPILLAHNSFDIRVKDQNNFNLSRKWLNLLYCNCLKCKDNLLLQ